VQLRLAAPVAVLALAGAAVPAVATSTAAARGRIEFADSSEVRGDLGPETGTPAQWASRALRSQAGRLGYDASTMRIERVRTSLIGTHVRGRQYRGGVPIAGTELLVSALAGRVAQVNVESSALPGEPTAAPVGELVAKAAALGHLHVTDVLGEVTVERVLSPYRGVLVDTYRVGVGAQRPVRASRVDVDAATGRVLAVVDEGLEDAGTAHVFEPNPVVTSRNTGLRQPLELGLPTNVPLASAEVTAELRALPITLTPGTYLQGDWASLTYPAGYGGTDLSFPRTDPRFVGLSAYAHVDRYQRWLQSLGLTGVNAEPQQLVALTRGDDNSAYYPSNDLIVFQGGGVPDAEDGEVVLHEYGHAIQDAQEDGVSGSSETGAMGEGFGDFNAANFFALTSRGFGDLCVADWDATTYSSADPPCLRRLDSAKRYPKDLVREVHADGELWSAFLWRVRSQLARSSGTRSVNAITLVLTAHELMSPTGTFKQSVAALRTAARALKHPEWVAVIEREARVTGFPVS
jgi:hypothetical protein